MKKQLIDTRQKIGFFLMAVLIFIVPVIIFMQEPIAQDPGYHLFKDTRFIFSVNNFYNVISNIPFLMVGLLGLYKIIISNQLKLLVELKLAYLLLYFGLVLVAFGSGYYHLEPNNQTLLWDRLPMTISFMALMSVLIGEFLSVKTAKLILMPLIIVGIASVLHWYLGELKGVGDLRFYILVQFVPVLSIPIILSFFKSSFKQVYGYWLLLLAYIVAKILEYFDGEVFGFSGLVSGHSLKHVMAALGMFLLLNYFEKRKTSLL